jgi:hypothetical protein
MADNSFTRFVPGPLGALPDALAQMKQAVFSFAVFFASLVAARADLVMEQQTSETNATTHITLKLHGDKMRMDQQIGKNPAFIVIIDLNTRDSITLLPREKQFLKRSGLEIQQQMEAERKASHGTNEMDNPPARAVDTGQSAMVDGYGTEIFKWSGAHGLTETLWVATNYPDYESIRIELAKIDRFDASGPHKNGQPELSLLPGMVIKAETAARGRKVTTTLLSAKAEPVDASLFELPADYSPRKTPASPRKTNSVLTPIK